MDEICKAGDEVVYDGQTIKSGHMFQEVDQPDKKKVLARCMVCGYESVGFVTSDTKLNVKDINDLLS